MTEAPEFTSGWRSMTLLSLSFWLILGASQFVYLIERKRFRTRDGPTMGRSQNARSMLRCTAVHCPPSITDTLGTTPMTSGSRIDGATSGAMLCGVRPRTT